MLGKNLVNNQYFTNRLLSDFDFWLVDRNQSMKEARFNNRFSEKNLICRNGLIWAKKLCFLITLDPLEQVFKILHNERD